MIKMKDYDYLALEIAEYGFSYIVGDENLNDFVKYCDETGLLVEIVDCGTILTSSGEKGMYFVKEK